MVDIDYIARGDADVGPVSRCVSDAYHSTPA